jgi:hypothetical protein
MQTVFCNWDTLGLFSIWTAEDFHFQCVCECVWVCVSVSVRERVCVCVFERERERERGREKEAFIHTNTQLWSEMQYKPKNF